jgi:hypothetical protein
LLAITEKKVGTAVVNGTSADSTIQTPSTAPYSQSPYELPRETTRSWLEQTVPVPTSEVSSSPEEVEERTVFEEELLSHFPNKDRADELISLYFSSTDVCMTTFRLTFYQSYNKLWNTFPHHVNVPFLGVVYIAMANAIHCQPDLEGPNAEKMKQEMELYDKLSNQITEDVRYNFHVETVEAVMLQAMFLVNSVYLTVENLT